MWIDGRTLPAGHQLETDLCIVGAGPAGIAIALAFADSPVRTCLLEAGGFEFDDEVQNQCQTEGDAYDGYGTRLAFFGGSSNHWGGYCRPLDPIDFESRPWIPHSGWPIRRADLDPYYPIAARLVQIGPLDVDPAAWAARLGAQLFPVGAEDPVRNVAFQVSPPTRFGEVYRDPLLASPNLTICLNSKVVGFRLRPGEAALEAVEAKTLEGNSFRVRAACFVLAGGGIENPRILLLAQRAEDGAPFRQNELVGRFFMEHMHFALGSLVLADPAFSASFYTRALSGPDGREANLHLGLRAEIEEQEQIANALAQFHTHAPGPGERSLQHIRDALLMGHYPENLGRHLRNVLHDIGEVSELLAHEVGTKLFGMSDDSSVLVVRSVGEQVPNPDSRVMLADTFDDYGLPRARVAWATSDTDRISTVRFATLLAREFGRLGIGRMRLAFDPASDRMPEMVEEGCHHMGTTRMADDPSQGVVDRNCRLHGLANLYVAGSSVFPTGSCANPTLTILALAARLADHLKSTMFA
jgi:choline dehydrogenase-like flavoprotein